MSLSISVRRSDWRDEPVRIVAALHETRAATTIAIVTFLVLVLEITSTRLFAYIGSSHATSIALSIAMLGLNANAAIRVRVT